MNVLINFLIFKINFLFCKKNCCLLEIIILMFFVGLEPGKFGFGDINCEVLPYEMEICVSLINLRNFHCIILFCNPIMDHIIKNNEFNVDKVLWHQ